ncbi:hypothetical protein NQT69_03405 [Pseudoalteromonas shioyasakiensis]|uniref:hypothetical protein n=1 Tax=Pseudoalteromonas shioyasakiensis TaxID=1190813 RepID=UPI002118AEB6|nr:hypothetical protein [Pseudoalteromonas shioyasakiensis]MCQ8877085.1 hypothetical protein [Pseudoalteromonas shioyasakiensis]
MNEGIIGIFVLVTIATISSIASHLLIKQYFVAIVISGLIGTLLFQLSAYLYAGHLDPFFLVTVFVSFLAICVISSLIGLIKMKKNKS